MSELGGVEEFVGGTVATVEVADVNAAEVELDSAERVNVTVFAGLELFAAKLEGGCPTQLVSAFWRVNKLFCLKRYLALTTLLDSETTGLRKSTTAIVDLQRNEGA